MEKTHQLIIRETSGEPWVYTLTEEPTKIGRARTCELRIPDARISREHCIIRWHGNHFVIADLDSRNGFRVNGIPEKEKKLEANDRITIGFTSLIYLEKETTEGNIYITQDEPNETFSFTLDLTNDEEKIFSHQRLDFLNKFLSCLNSEEEAELVFVKCLTMIKESTPIKNAYIAIYDKKELELLNDYKTTTHNLKISRKTLTKAIDQKESFIIVSQEKQAEDQLAIITLYANDHISCVLILAITENQILEDNELKSLFQIISKLLGITLKRHMMLLNLQKQLQLKKQSEVEFDIIGNSEVMKRVYQLIRKIGPVDATALIIGESGTGKELVAKAIHQISKRKGQPFVTINCGAIPVNLIESELFGHEKGAFTGAIKFHMGCFEQANHGTLFLDEIGELDPNVQVKLLRALETKTIRRVGGDRDIPVNIRVIAATHRDLDKMVKEGSFREDLYFRLQVIEIAVPPLRNRLDDIPLLSDYYISKLCVEMGKPSIEITEDAITILNKYQWPGNVRELKNAIERAVVLGNNQKITADSFMHLVQSKNVNNTKFSTPNQVEETEENFLTLKDIEQIHILKAMKVTGGNKRKAAEILGIERKTLYNKLLQIGYQE